MKENKYIKWTYLTHAVAWISVSIAICFSIYYTKSFWGLLAFGFLGSPIIDCKIKRDDNEVEDNLDD